MRMSFLGINKIKVNINVDKKNINKDSLISFDLDFLSEDNLFLNKYWLDLLFRLNIFRLDIKPANKKFIVN